MANSEKKKNASKKSGAGKTAAKAKDNNKKRKPTRKQQQLKKKARLRAAGLLLLCLLFFCGGYFLRGTAGNDRSPSEFLSDTWNQVLDSAQSLWNGIRGRWETPVPESGLSLEEIPPYSGSPYGIINENRPFFQESEYTLTASEHYSFRDFLGRCGTAYACLGPELMPDSPREEIQEIKPSGWVNHSYDFIDGGFVYNRCHLIGFQLAGENANARNLITGTRYLNVEGMLPFENRVAEYIRDTGCHVLYRVTPIYEGKNLVANGVEMEAFSVEDNGEGICFHVYCYNVQPGVEIDYATGENRVK